MKLEPGDYDFLSNFGTVGAIVLGAVLATFGGLAATQIEWHFERRRRERQSALFFGEVLSTLVIILRIAKQTKGVGDPYGPITMRMLRQAQREIGTYERNRETLYNLRNAELRSRIHTLVLRISTPLDGIFDTTEEIAKGRAQLRSPEFTAEERQEIDARIGRLTEMRENGFAFIEEGMNDVEILVKDLEPVARHRFADTRTAAQM